MSEAFHDIVKDYISELQTILIVNKPMSNSYEAKVKYWLDSHIVVVIPIIAPSIILAY